MTYNTFAYIIYLILTVFIIVYVGKLLHRNGRLFILSLMSGDAVTTDHLNNILLVAYYLFNIGYAFIKLHFWQKIGSFEILVSSIANKISVLIFILAFTHYLNMALIWMMSGSKKTFITFKSFQS